MYLTSIENRLAKTGYKSRAGLAADARVLGMVVREDDRMNSKTEGGKDNEA